MKNTILLVDVVFFWLTARFYKNVLYAYDHIAIWVVLTVAVHSWVFSVTNIKALLITHGVDVTLTILSLVMLAIAKIAVMFFPQKDTAFDGQQGLYGKPLRVAAIILALSASLHSLVLFGISPVITIPVMFVIGLSGVVVLMANHSLYKDSVLAVVGIFLICTVLLWFESIIFHRHEMFSMLSGKAAGDQWITLAGTGCILSFLSYKTGKKGADGRLFQYQWPIWIVGVIFSGYGLLETVPLFISGLKGDIKTLYGPSMLLIQTATVLPVLQPFKNAPLLRGVGLLVLLTGFVCGVVSVLGLKPWTETGRIVWGFLLWGIGQWAVPAFNLRFSEFKVSPFVWPWAGLIVISGNFFIDFNIVNNFPSSWPCWLSLSVYTFVMTRNSSSAIFSWLSTGALFLTVFLYILTLTDYLPYLIISILVTANILFGFAKLWEKYGSIAVAGLGLQKPDFARPSIIYSCLSLIGLLGFLLFIDTGVFFFHSQSVYNWKYDILIRV
ncbi:MAG TPA: hypothetical protein VJL89_13105 [Thermodesulfovibrionia bacterium]|nr:hypothetical protein [Thermodesulfovibrionia bacterium]